MKNSPLYIIWSDENNTGYSIIDEQHKGIAATINSLYYFIQQGHGLDALKPTLQIVRTYIGFHLKTEEMILESLNYPLLDEQKAFHEKTFVDFNNTAKEAILNKEPELLLKFLKDWWFAHMKDHKEKYNKYLIG